MQSNNSCRNKAFDIVTHRRLYIPRPIWLYANLFPLQISLVLTDVYSFHFSRSTGKRPIWCWTSSTSWIIKSKELSKILRILGAISSFLGNWNDSWYDWIIQWYSMRFEKEIAPNSRSIESNWSYFDRVEFRALWVATIYLSK